MPVVSAKPMPALLALKPLKRTDWCPVCCCEVTEPCSCPTHCSHYAENAVVVELPRRFFEHHTGELGRSSTAIVLAWRTTTVRVYLDPTALLDLKLSAKQRHHYGLQSSARATLAALP